jgi:MazG family protein
MSPSPKIQVTENTLETLMSIVKKLRDPETGCPWDKVQTSSTIAEYAIEEAYEVVEAIENNDPESLKEELGDLLFQILFHSHIAAENGLFNLYEVIDALSEKMIRRHPHVFSETKAISEEEQSLLWEEQKKSERQQKSTTNNAFSGIPLSLPALLRSQKIQKRAAQVGFDWKIIDGVFDKIQEEIVELKEAINEKNSNQIENELGDIIFSCVNLSRHLKLNAETALRKSTEKFIQRFSWIESRLSQQKRQLEECSPTELHTLWLEAKSAETN